MKTLISIAALSLVSATPVLAADPLPAPRATPATEDAAPTTTATPAAKRTRYCIVQDRPTGTHLIRKTCNTRENWLKQGFDPLNPTAE